MLNKRVREDSPAEKSGKKPTRSLITYLDSDDDQVGFHEDKVFYFRVLLPNGTTVELEVVCSPNHEMPLRDFVDMVKKEYQHLVGRRTGSSESKGQVLWSSQDLHLIDALENKINNVLRFRSFKPNKSHMLRLCDGSAEADKYENMWDLTPDTSLLKELPEDYTFETALADLIDNSLQAVWSNRENQRRLIRLDITEKKIVIFDTGPGMDGSDKNSIVKWGKMGASLHRSDRERGIGGKPPYLTPFFGMFGYGGPMASMSLGRRASVSSKTKESKKVYVLHLEKESLLNSSSKKTWRTSGSIRDPAEDELNESADGSFTKVEIFLPEMKRGSVQQLQYKLKDIYFPYIQCDEASSTGRTLMPIEFKVNGMNLAEVIGGEVATTNLLSCNGPEFILELSFHVNDSVSSKVSSGKRSCVEANARLRCVYFPLVQGKESIDEILENLEAFGYEITENFESFSHVSVRRLGRLLPDARWAWLPFMLPNNNKQRKGDRADILKRCSFRVKCFVETDAGFKPTPSKTDLAHQHHYTIALRNFGAKTSDKEKDVHVEISKDGKKLSFEKVEKLYKDWIFQMHELYDKEIECGEDQPTIVLCSSHQKELGFSADVMRIHKVFRRKGATWKSGQKIKILKGAYKGFHNNNVYATLEFIILDGCEGDSGEIRIICRPLSVSAEAGCQLKFDKGGSPCIEIRESKCLPISVIDAGKCLTVDDKEWENQISKYQHKTTPSSIDILDAKQCQDLGIEGALPEDVIDAGHEPPEIVAVVRPASSSSVSMSGLDQKCIMKENFEMTLEVKLSAVGGEKPRHIYSCRVSPSSCKGLKGLYIFNLQQKVPNIFHVAGLYLFRFTLKESGMKLEKKVHVKALSEADSWKLISDGKTTPPVRVGSCFSEILSVACYDSFSNHIPFKLHTEVELSLSSSGSDAQFECSFDHCITDDGYLMKLKNVMIESSDLDKIRPSYKATLHISSTDDPVSVAIPCVVLPGPLHQVLVHHVDFGNKLFPGMTIKELSLETLDKYGNHMRKDEHIKLKLEGLQFLDKGDHFAEVGDHGFVNLSGALKVTSGFGKPVSLSVFSGDEVIFKKEFQIEKRSLQVASKVPEVCAAGSNLEDIVFEVINSAGEVDEDIHDDEESSHSHTLLIKQDSLDNVKYSFRRGRCVVHSIPLPLEEGLFRVVASHSRFDELQTSIEVHVEKAVNSSMHEMITQPKSPKKELMLLEDLYPLESPGMIYNELSTAGSSSQLKNSCDSGDLDGRQLLIAQRGLEDDICEYGQRIRESNAKLEKLHFAHSNIEIEMSNLGGSGYDKDMVVQMIQQKADSAAAVLLRSPKSEDVHILGVVALLGQVENHKLSCMLSSFLGEDQMLALVCKSRATARALEKCRMDGKDSPLDILADKLGIFINAPYSVICLEDLRPYRRGVGTDSQRELTLPAPASSNGETPLGFLGYAVNKIFLPMEHVHLRTTLFYFLLGELQVYESRQHLYMARSCIQDSAVSLDGGMIRRKGVVTVGFGQPNIVFPVMCQLRLDWVAKVKVLEEKKRELGETIKETSSRRDKDMKKLNKKIEYKRKVDQLLFEKFGASLPHEDMDISS